MPQMFTAADIKEPGYAHFIGRVHWGCPYCGHDNTHRFRALTWKLICHRCERVLAFRMQLAQVPRGVHNRTQLTATPFLVPAPVDPALSVAT